MSMSSGCLSGQLTVIMNSSLGSTLPSSSLVLIASSAMKNRKAITCSALNSMTPSGSNGASFAREFKLVDHFACSASRSSSDTAWTSMTPTAKANSLAVASSSIVIPDADQDRTDQPRQRGDYIATAMPLAHQVHGGLDGALIAGVEASDRRQHHDEANYRADQAEFHQRVAGKAAEAVRAAQFPARRRSSSVWSSCRPLCSADFTARSRICDAIRPLVTHRRRRSRHRRRPTTMRWPPSANQLRCTPRRVGFARHCDQAPQAMQRRTEIEQYDHRRDIGAIDGKHLPHQAIVPKQNRRRTGRAR